MKSNRFADIFPMMDKIDFENLKRDIKENGLLEPIVIYEGKILDGRNRYRACKDLKIKPKLKEYHGKNPLELVISLNLKRRHLTPSQISVIALDALPLLEKEAKERMLRGNPREKNPEGKGRSSEHAGLMFGVNERYIREAKKLKETSPELLEEVRSGKKNLSEVRDKGNDGKGNNHLRDGWKTPDWIFCPLDEQFKFEFDCCASIYNSRCSNFSGSFEGKRKVKGMAWMNPPFSIARKMFEHFFKIIKRGIAIYRCDNLETEIWQKIIFPHADWIFIPDRRVNYEGFDGEGSRFPSVLIGIGVDPPKKLNGINLEVLSEMGRQKVRVRK